LHVLLDIYALGRGLTKRERRRGIFRYVENLVDGLVERDDLDLTFCSSDSWHFVYQCIDYLKLNEKLEYFEFIQPDAEFMSWVSKEFVRLDEEAKFKSTRVNGIAKRFKREVLRAFFKIHSRQRGDVFDLKYFPETDILHTPDFVFMAPQARELNSARNFVTVHDIIPVVTPQYVQPDNVVQFTERLAALNEEDWIFTVSQFSADDLCDYASHIDPEKVIPAPLAAAGHFNPCEDVEILRRVRAKYKIPEQGTYLLSLSALEPRKNFELIINSYQDLVMQEKMDDLFLVLVGQEVPGFKPYLEKYIKTSDIRDRIIFTGFIPDEDLSPIYSGAAAFLFPSFYEGFGLPPLEAMKCGAPVIASNRSSIPEVVGDAGILIDPNSVDELSHAVTRVLNDSSFRKELSEKSLARAVEFSWEKHAEMTVAGYKRALDS
jgi:glycosyltransferase involved in cell wall biosynthesis